MITLTPTLSQERGRPGSLRSGFGRIEIQLHLRPHRIVAEDLPDAGSDLLEKRVLDAVGLEAFDRPLQVSRAEGDMVDDAGALRRKLALGDVQDRAAAGIEPRTIE